MYELKEKLRKISTASKKTAESLRTVIRSSPMLIIYVLHMLWPDFRPFSILFVLGIGLIWNRPPPETVPLSEMHPPAPMTTILGEVCSRIWAQRTTRPIRMVMGSVAGILVIAFLIYYVLPWWVTLATTGVLVTWERWQFDVTYSFSNASAMRDAFNEQEIAEFMPEITEVNRVLLQEVGEQGVDTVPAIEAVVQAKNTAEEDEELYLNTLLPEASSNDFETAEHSGSSSDELFCPEGPELRKPSSRQLVHALPATEKPIEFKSSHFNANSSSDSDDNISRGLCFNDELDVGEDGPRRRPGRAPEAPVRYDLLTASNLVSNVLVDTVCKRLLDSAALHGGLSQPHGFEQQNPMLGTISNTLHALRGPAATLPENDESTDEDSDFEMLNSEELNNL